MPDEPSNQNIERNASFGRECQCKDLGDTKYCGKITVYGDYRDIPGTKHITGPIAAVFIVLGTVLGLSWFVYSCWRYSQVKRMVQDHFYDWKQKGIQVEYHPPSGDEYNNVPGHISLTLPQTVPAVSESVPDQNCYSFENSTNVQSV